MKGNGGEGGGGISDNLSIQQFVDELVKEIASNKEQAASIFRKARPIQEWQPGPGNNFEFRQKGAF